MLGIRTYLVVVFSETPFQIVCIAGVESAILSAPYNIYIVHEPISCEGLIAPRILYALDTPSATTMMEPGSTSRNNLSSRPTKGGEIRVQADHGGSLCGGADSHRTEPHNHPQGDAVS